jgi:Cys/Met metabolism PLP-dependent enzyme
VHYPGLASHPQHELARRQTPGGFGGMMSFVVAGSTAKERFKRAQRVLRKVRLCTSAASLGGAETLIIHPASMIFSHQSPDQLTAVGVEPGLLRLSVGLEDHQDIVDDLTSALSGIKKASVPTPSTRASVGAVERIRRAVFSAESKVSPFAEIKGYASRVERTNANAAPAPERSRRLCDRRQILSERLWVLRFWIG